MTAVASPCLLREKLMPHIFLIVFDSGCQLIERASEEFSFLWFWSKDTGGFSSDGRRQTHCPVYFNARNDTQFFFFYALA
jgi:hypothetical protein